jgi:membrane protein DedA with SNARE-associated domain
MIESVTSYLAGLDPSWLYLALFVFSYIENVFPPVPGDTVTIFAGYLLGRSDHNPVGVVIATTLGSSAGFMTYYALGRLIHPEFFARKNFRFLPASKIELAGAWFQRYGYWIVLLNRLFSGVRSVISIVTGMYRLSWLRVFVLSGIGCLVWNAVLIWGGYMLGVNWMMINRVLAQYNKVLIILAVLLGGFWLVRRKILSKAKN